MGFVRTFNEDGKEFIRTATKALTTTKTWEFVTERPRKGTKGLEKVYMSSPRTFSHYVLNLPASAINFLPSFVGMYAEHSSLFEANEPIPLPMLHVYCFSTKSDDNKEEERAICKEISGQIDFEINPGDPSIEGKAEIWDVRDVAPNKRMFCASFRLPREIAFRNSHTV